MGFPGGSGTKESACNAGDLGSIPYWGREWLSTLVFLPGEFHNQRSLGWGATIHGWGHKESDMLVQLSLSCSSYYARDAFNNHKVGKIPEPLRLPF